MRGAVYHRTLSFLTGARASRLPPVLPATRQQNSPQNTQTIRATNEDRPQMTQIEQIGTDMKKPCSYRSDPLLLRHLRLNPFFTLTSGSLHTQSRAHRNTGGFMTPPTILILFICVHLWLNIFCLLPPTDQRNHFGRLF